MQRLLGPTLLTLTLAMPTASLALGLGDIRIDSALHQPLVAQIELVGAVDDELGRLSAAIASDELFQRYNLERAPFIAGTTLTVGRDAQGRPVLNMRSTEKFTEPVVTLLVDLNTPKGKLVREYTLFLDPAGLPSKAAVVSNAAVVSDAGTASAARVESDPAAGSNGGPVLNDRSASSAPRRDGTSAASGPAAGTDGKTSRIGRPTAVDSPSPASVSGATVGSRSPASASAAAVGSRSPASASAAAVGALSPASAPAPTVGSLSPASAPGTAVGSLSPASAPAPTVGSRSPASASAAAVGALSPASAPAPTVGSRSPASVPATAVSNSKLPGQTYTVARRDTLDHIVTAAGARSRTERHRMMIAIFRANPAAFQNNFNRMHAGVALRFPTEDQLAAISVEETTREYDAQMAAWRASRGGSGNSIATSAGVVPVLASTRDVASAGVTSASAAVLAADPAKDNELPADHAALKQRIASLELSLARIQQQLRQPQLATAANSTAVAESGAPPSTVAAAVRAAMVTASAAASRPADIGSMATHAPSDTAADAASAVSRAAAPVTVATIAASHEAAPPVTVATMAASHEAAPPVTVAAMAASREAAPPVTVAAMAASRAAAPTTPSHAIAAVATADNNAAIAADDETTSDDEVVAPTPQHRALKLVATAISAGLLCFAGAGFFFRRRNSNAYYTSPKYDTATVEAAASEKKADDTVEFIEPSHSLPRALAVVSEAATAGNAASEPQQEPAQKAAKKASSWFEDSFSTPIADLLNDPTVSLAVEQTAELPAEPTLELRAGPANDIGDTEVLVAPELELAGATVEQKFSFFNPEANTNTEHVVMGSALHEPKPFVERRKNPADVLRQAIEREPDRSDLRLKLLELYYTAAAENRRAFLDATRQLAKNEKLASAEDWSRISDMGRIIAPDDELFSSKLDDQRVA